MNALKPSSTLEGTLIAFKEPFCTLKGIISEAPETVSFSAALISPSNPVNGLKPHSSFNGSLEATPKETYNILY